MSGSRRSEGSGYTPATRHATPLSKTGSIPAWFEKARVSLDFDQEVGVAFAIEFVESLEEIGDLSWGL